MQKPLKLLGLFNALKMGHCAPSVMRTLQESCSLKNENVLKSTAGLPAGIGWMGNECGCVTSAVIILGLKYGHEQLRNKYAPLPKIIPVGQAFLRKFKSAYGGIYCREISKIDYNEKELVRTGILGASSRCFKAICGGPGLLTDSMAQDTHEKTLDLNKETIHAQAELIEFFKDREFHCSQSLLNRLNVLDRGEADAFLGSWGFLGGTLLQGYTCGVLSAAAIFIGLRFGAIEESYRRVMRWTLQSFIDGDIKREDLNKFNRAINITHEMALWFREEFGSTRCQDLINTNFYTQEGVEKYISEQQIDFCKDIVTRTEEKVRQIIMKYC